MNKTTKRKIGDTNYIVNCSYDETKPIKEVFETLIINEFLKTLSYSKGIDKVDDRANIPYNISGC